MVQIMNMFFVIGHVPSNRTKTISWNKLNCSIKLDMFHLIGHELFHGTYDFVIWNQTESINILIYPLQKYFIDNYPLFECID